MHRDLIKRDCDKSMKQMQDKLKALKKIYKSVKDRNNTSGKGRKDCPFFHELNEILGCRDVSVPKIRIDMGIKKKTGFQPIVVRDAIPDVENIPPENFLNVTIDDGVILLESTPSTSTSSTSTPSIHAQYLHAK
ncbi:hypothetical protein JTE90_003339 [Oedothorax gibbosus]|uniref:Myb/SANT-like DNA-binding domain-containing protein n=1 Tax=Oedothorax gibbosus TaxID=931172 RepID=A0AAV6UF02_9ARAC|nr:hypothetical protein JTE90_003339 [Oedothorax gibbosus]